MQDVADRGNRRKFTAEVEATICQEYLSGNYSQRELAAKYEITHQTIRKILERGGFGGIKPVKPIVRHEAE